MTELSEQSAKRLAAVMLVLAAMFLLAGLSQLLMKLKEGAEVW
ncbi:hypothetical protein [Paenibacillus gansuensis]|uniref:Uncharacterized protein n=1 Tax=Paenibacillus gansuensis TaxID=306542 RepID=A0ABW5PA69_9BACL